jgi:hypothetical protein
MGSRLGAVERAAPCPFPQQALDCKSHGVVRFPFLETAPPDHVHFFVLPLNRLDGYSRWLRLLVSQALRIERGAERPQPPRSPYRPPIGRLKALALSCWGVVMGRLMAVGRDMGLMVGYDL